MSDKSRERFEAWFGAAWGFPPWSITDDLDDARDADITWSAWQARDTEVKELVEAGLALVTWYDRDGSVGGLCDPIEDMRAILAKHEGGK